MLEVNPLVVRGLSLAFRMYEGAFSRRELCVISNLSVIVREGEIHAVAGASGSGKSLLAHAILGILPRNAIVGGEMLWFGQPMNSDLRRKLRGRELALVPQSVTYLDPLMKVGRQVTGDRDKMSEVFGKYGLSEDVAGKYPFQLSGGMARRILVSTAAIAGAKVIVADEPTPGLSPELAEAAMSGFRDLARGGAAVLLITHDIDLALRYADRISVFYAGTTVETAKASDFADEQLLRHPYSRAMWRAMPQHGFMPTAGRQPYAGTLPRGCLFAPRCRYKTAECESAAPAVHTLRGGEVSCYHAT
jgi:peptide/nickel transport system ATP-binding protein